MNSTIDFAIASANIFSMDLDKVEFSDFGADRMTLKIEMSTSAGFDDPNKTDIIENLYYADYQGKVTLYGLGKIWNDHILAWCTKGGDEKPLDTIYRSIYARFTYSYQGEEDVETASVIRSIYYSSRYVNKTPEEMQNFIPLVGRKKRTFFDFSEPFFLIDGTGFGRRNISVGLAYKDEGLAKYHEMAIEEDDHGGSFMYFDFSPERLLNFLNFDLKKEINLNSLLFFDVLLYDGDQLLDKCRYTIEHRNFSQHSEFCYMNMLGAFESVGFTGLLTNTPEREAEYGYCGDDYAALDLQVNDVIEINTGWCNKEMMAQVRDMIESPLILKRENGEWKKVVITAIDYSISRPTNSSFNAKITYRYADEVDALDADLIPWMDKKVFERPQFDRSFA